MENSPIEHPEIKGWGVDINTDNDPTYPIRIRTSEAEKGYNWKRPDQQPVDIEVLKSIERPNISAVFGTAVPPSGLSGAIRRFAFKYGEASFAHWVPLVMADRINEIEGILSDIGHGRVPNIFAEKGIKAQWKFDRGSVVKKIIAGGILASAAIAALVVVKTRND